MWLVTPLVSRLQQSVLGRVLKCAGHVLGQGQWWNPEKSQEKRRSTRATRCGGEGGEGRGEERRGGGRVGESKGRVKKGWEKSKCIKHTHVYVISS